ncbi:MAG: YbbR-like domain-containing protein [Bacteroidales bacterium]|jgi:hypothetical protein|nr:YbbR-like domain-containing protein [Bacteroidales bacterium]
MVRFLMSVFGKKGNFKREMLVYLLFLLIAIVIWYLNALNKTYTTDLKFNAQFVNLPKDKILVKAPDNNLTFTVEAQGFTLLKYRIGLVFRSIAINADYHLLKYGKNGEYYTPTSTVMKNVSEQLGTDINLLRIWPDTLKFVFSEMVKKTVPVKIRAHFRYEKEFSALDSVQVDPERIMVSGPRSLIDTLRFVSSVHKTFKGLKDSLKTKIELQPIEKISYQVKEVSIVLPVERMTEASVTVGIETVNLPKGLVMKTFPGSITINCLIPVSRFDKLHSQMFRATVDYETVIRSKEAKAKVMISKSPHYVQDIRFHPKNVDFIVEK